MENYPEPQTLSQMLKFGLSNRRHELEQRREQSCVTLLFLVKYSSLTDSLTKELAVAVKSQTLKPPIMMYLRL